MPEKKIGYPVTISVQTRLICSKHLKDMKKAILSIIVLALGAGIFAQSGDINRLYYTYQGESEVISMYIPGFLCRLAASLGDLEYEEEVLLRSIKSIKLLVVENDAINERVNFVDEINFDGKNSEYVMMLTVHEEDQDVLILGRKKGDCIRDLVIIVGGEENVMVSIKGRLDADMLYALSGITGIEQMKYTKEL